MMVMTINNPETKRRTDEAGDVHRGQRPRQRDSGRGGVPLHHLVLMEHYTRVPQIRKLVDERVFYIVPTVNPDGYVSTSST